MSFLEEKDIQNVSYHIVNEDDVCIKIKKKQFCMKITIEY